MLTAYALISPNNELKLSSIHKNREDAEKDLVAEYPPGYIIYPNHKVVEIRIDVIGY
jgi:hypothetical protein